MPQIQRTESSDQVQEFTTGCVPEIIAFATDECFGEVVLAPMPISTGLMYRSCNRAARSARSEMLASPVLASCGLLAWAAAGIPFAAWVFSA